MRTIRFLLTLVVLTLLVSLPEPGLAQATSLMVSIMNTPTYAVPGPYAVGLATYMVDKGTSQALMLVAWYPAGKQSGDNNGAALMVPDKYQVPSKAVDALRKWGTAAVFAAPDLSGAPYPLVIFSPGFGMGPSLYTKLIEHLASYGFVVLSPAFNAEHSPWEHYVTRPLLTSREIDFAETLTGQSGNLAGLINITHTAVVGHSSGGYAALAAAGAQLNYTWLEDELCTTHDVAGQLADVCSDLAAHSTDMLALAKLDSMPASVWPSWRDPRVTAIVSLAGDGYVFGPAGLASVTIPVMVQTGAQDLDNPPVWSTYLAYDNVSSTQKVQVSFAGSGHSIFMNYYSVVPTTELIHHFTTAFLLDTLKGDQAAREALLPNAAQFAGVDYKATMK